MQFDHSQISKVMVIDQSRNSQQSLSCIEGVDEVITFQINESEIAKLGHDHPAALNQAIRLDEISTTHVLIFDSDCIPIRANWLSQVNEGADVILAQDASKWGLSHPCFMKLPVAILEKINFAEGTLEIGIDTGRMVALQSVKLGYRPQMLVPQPAFSGVQGDLYLNDSLLHVGSSSFASSSDLRLKSKVNTFKYRFIYKKILKSSYSLSVIQVFMFQIVAVITQIRRRQ